MNSRWLKLDHAALDKAEHSKQKGVHFEVSMSPYDIPEDIRGFYCEERKKFFIEFRYMADEKTRNVEGPTGIVFRCGINSGRLYGIEADTDSLGINQVSVGIVDKVQSALKLARNTHFESRDRFPLRGEINQRLIDVAEQHVPFVLQTAS